MLSANSEANMSVECLMEDEDFHSQIGREELSFGGRGSRCSMMQQQLGRKQPYILGGELPTARKWVSSPQL